MTDYTDSLLKLLADPTEENAAHFEFQTRNLIMGGISYVEDLRAKMMKGEFPPSGIKPNPEDADTVEL